MKKILLALAIGSVSLLTLNSCTKEYITNNELVPSVTMVYERVANDWSGTDNSAYLELSVPELTQYYINQGIISVAISSNNEQTYHTIPSTFNAIAYSYDYSVGKIIIKAQDPILDDFLVEVPNNIVIKVSLTEADFIE